MVIGLATLATGAARKGLIAWGASVEAYPLTIVLVYGAYYAVISVAVFAPLLSGILAALLE